jgi:hypothetical protein
MLLLLQMVKGFSEVFDLEMHKIPGSSATKIHAQLQLHNDFFLSLLLSFRSQKPNSPSLAHECTLRRRELNQNNQKSLQPYL